MDKVLLKGGPVDGRVVDHLGGSLIFVPITTEPGLHMHDAIAVYDGQSGQYQVTQRGPGKSYPRCPGCGGRTTRADWAKGCEDPDCTLVMCVGEMGHGCPLAMHWKPEEAK